MATANTKTTSNLSSNGFTIIVSKSSDRDCQWTFSVPSIHITVVSRSKYTAINQIQEYLKTIQPDIAFSVTPQKVDKLILFSHLVELARAAMQQRNADAYYLRDLLISRVQNVGPSLNVPKLLQIGHDLVLGTESADADLFRSLAVGRDPNRERSPSMTTRSQKQKEFM